MGAYTTLAITRSKAISYIMEKLPMTDDEELSSILDKFTESRLYYTAVVPDQWPSNDDDTL